MKRVLVIGGYGNFGRFISKRLANDPNISLIIGGRSIDKAQILAAHLGAQAVFVDIDHDFANTLATVNPDIVIHTSGPFQGQGYAVAQTCIAQRRHYIDLADGVDFVQGIDTLDRAAKAKGVTVISGASSVPGLSSAIIEHYRSGFKTLTAVEYGITTAQKTNRGLATTAAILSYTGKPFSTLINGAMRIVYGWQDLRLYRYRGLGWRMLGNCSIPDLALFPKRYPTLKTIRFRAGMELPILHLGLWALSWLVRVGLIRHLERKTDTLVRVSNWFDCFGSKDSAFYMTMSGAGKSITFELVAHNGDGPYIPCIPSIFLAKKLAGGLPIPPGAQACIGLITLDEYLAALSHLNITWRIY